MVCTCPKNNNRHGVSLIVFYACRLPTGTQIDFNLFFFVFMFQLRVNEFIELNTTRGARVLCRCLTSFQCKFICRFIYATPVFQCCFSFMPIVQPRPRLWHVPSSLAHSVHLHEQDSLESKTMSQIARKK